MQVFAHDGESFFSGVWTTITSARGFDSKLIDVPIDATHYVKYTSGGTDSITPGQRIFGVVYDVTSSVGDTTDTSATIAGFTSAVTTQFGVGRYITASAQFADTNKFMEILSKTATTMTVDTAANGTGSNITTRQYPDAMVSAVVLENGTFAGGNAEGILLLNKVRGTFAAGNISVTALDGNIATIAEAPIEIGMRTPPKAALITVETAAINFTLDGTLPTATSGTNYGHKMDAGQSYVIRGYKNIRKFKCINAVASNGAIVKYTLFG